MIRYPEERSGARVFSQAMWEFDEFINELGLVDIHLSGGAFTWYRSGDRNQFSRIDRFLLSSDWDDCFSSSVQQCLPRVVSDHAPLLLDCRGLWKGKSPFRFENMWLLEPGFLEWIRAKWCSYEIVGNPCFMLAKKLKLLKDDLKIWNKEVFGRIDIKIKKTMEEIRLLDEKTGSEGLDEEEEQHREALRSELEHLLICEEVCCRQKSRVQWLKEGDKNQDFSIKWRLLTEMLIILGVS